jgi:hypothetical protein
VSRRSDELIAGYLRITRAMKKAHSLIERRSTQLAD